MLVVTIFILEEADSILWLFIKSMSESNKRNSNDI